MDRSGITDADRMAIKKVIDEFAAQVNTPARDWMHGWVKLAYAEDARSRPVGVTLRRRATVE